jgi:hypothetical protein
MTNGSPVYLTQNSGSPVYVAGAGAGTIPASAVANPSGSVTDQQIVTGAGGNVVAMPGFGSSVLFQSHLPFIVLPSGNIANSGVLTGAATLPVTYGSCYTYWAASTLATSGPGSTAGWYYSLMSSATAGTIYANTYTTGLPTIPGSPTALASTTAIGAYTGVTTTQSPQIYAMPGGTMGLRDTVRITTRCSVPNNGNNKQIQPSFGGLAIGFPTNTTTVLSQIIQGNVSNRESLSVQIASTANVLSYTSQANNFTTLGIATASAVNITSILGHSTATDYAVCESMIVELLYGS